MNKVDYYYNCLLEYTNFLFPKQNIKSLSSNKSPIKKLLSRIIDKNNEYLLTKSYMYYLILDSMCIYNGNISDKFRDVLYEKLLNLALGENEKIMDLIYYLNLIETGQTLYLGFSEIETKRVKYLLDEDIKNLINDFHYSLIRLKANSKYIQDADYRLILNSFRIICSLCIINQNYEDYNLIIDNIFNNMDSFLERLKLNGKFIINNRINFNNLIISVKCILGNNKLLIK